MGSKGWVGRGLVHEGMIEDSAIDLADECNYMIAYCTIANVSGFVRYVA
jgi:hypothetical protein